MGIIRSNDPLTWGDVDGIILNETAPASNVAGVAANVALLVGQSQRGPSELKDITSLTMAQETYGKDKTKGLNKVLKNKTFGALKFIRVVAGNAAKATRTFNDGAVEDPVSIIKFDAKDAGSYGNNLKVKIEAGSIQGKKYTITDSNPETVLNPEVYDNILIAAAYAENPFAKSKLATVTILSQASEPANAAEVSMAGGSDGVVADTDYENAIAKALVAGAGNVIFLDEYNATRNQYLKIHVAEARDKMVIVTGKSDDDSSDAIADVQNFRDTDGRIIYAFNDVITTVDGQEVIQPAAWWIAAAFTQCPAHVDLAFGENSQFFAGVIRLVHSLSPTEYKLLNKAGICSLEYDPDVGHKVKSAVVTQILNTEKQTILRRRMTDFLQDSLAKYLKNYSNGVNSATKRKLCKAGIVRFDDKLSADGPGQVLPNEKDMVGGALHRLIDTESQNTNESIGEGFFKIVYKRRIFSSMRYIVLTTEIGPGVVIVSEAS